MKEQKTLASETKTEKKAAKASSGDAKIFAVSNLIKEKVKETYSHLPFRQKIEEKVEEGLQKTLSLLSIPSKDEINRLNDRLDQLLKRCDSLGDASVPQSGASPDSAPPANGSLQE